MLKDFIKDENGLTSLEWVVLGAAMIGVITIAFPTLQGIFRGFFTGRVQDSLD